MASTTPVPSQGSHLTIFAEMQTRTRIHLDALTKTDNLHFISGKYLVDCNRHCNVIAIHMV